MLKDMTHDKLYFAKHLHVHSQKKTLSHTRTLKQTNKTTTTRSNCNCMVRTQAINNKNALTAAFTSHLLGD